MQLIWIRLSCDLRGRSIIFFYQSVKQIAFQQKLIVVKAENVMNRSGKHSIYEENADLKDR